MAKLKKTKEEIIKKAEELATAYEAQYRGCAECTFMAIVDALRWGGLELIPQDMEERLFPAINTLSGGTAKSTDGTCGAIIGSAMAIGLAMGTLRDSPDAVDTRHKSNAFIRNKILNKFYNEYRSILCKDIQRKRYGLTWDLTIPEMGQEFLAQAEGCVIIEIAKLTVELILDEFEKGNLKGQYQVL